jgi:hypothetical protein
MKIGSKDKIERKDILLDAVTIAVRQNPQVANRNR